MNQLVTSVTLVTLVCMTLVVMSYPRFKMQIPNGFNVPNPCNSSLWPGIGHLAVGGGGPRNPFGLDFAAAGFVWTDTLCHTDSDKDGQTNGQELGDPNCIFTVGFTGTLQAPSGQPGICEPVGSPACAWQNFTC